MGSIPVTLVIFFKSTRYEIFSPTKVLNYKVNIKALKIIRKKEFRQWRLLKVRGPFFKKKFLENKVFPLFSNNYTFSNKNLSPKGVFTKNFKINKSLNPNRQLRTLYSDFKPFRFKITSSKNTNLKFQLENLPYSNKIDLNFNNPYYSNLFIYSKDTNKRPLKKRTPSRITALKKLFYEVNPIKPFSEALFEWNELLEKDLKDIEDGVDLLDLDSKDPEILDLDDLGNLNFKMSKVYLAEKLIKPPFPNKVPLVYTFFTKKIEKKSNNKGSSSLNPSSSVRKLNTRLLIRGLKGRYSSAPFKAHLNKLTFLRNLNFPKSPPKNASYRYSKYPLKLFFQKKLNNLTTLSSNSLRGLIYDTWSGTRNSKFSIFLQKLLFKKLFLLGRKFHPFSIKPWLLDLVLDPKLLPLKDQEKAEGIRKSTQEEALDNPVTVEGKEFMVIDEGWLGSKLQNFHQKASNRYLFLNTHIGSLKFWDSPNFIFSQKIDTSIRFRNPKSYLSYYHLPSKYILTFFKKIFKKKKFINYFTFFSKNFSKNFKNRGFYINYPSFNKKLTNRFYSNPIIPKFELLGEENQIKSKFKNPKSIYTTLKLPNKLPLQLLLLSTNRSTIKSLFFLDFSYKSLFFLENLYPFFIESFLQNFFINKLESLLIPISLTCSNNIVSTSLQFFNTNRRASLPLKPLFNTNFKLPSLRRDTLSNKMVKSELNTLSRFYSRYIPYFIFRVNIRQNPVRRPLYSAFLTSSKISKVHSFRLTLDKKTLSLIKYPISYLNNKGQQLNNSNLIKASFFYKNNDNLFEIKIDNTLMSYSNIYLSLNKSLVCSPVFSQNYTFNDNPKPSFFNTVENLRQRGDLKKNSSVWLLTNNNISPDANIFNFPFLYKFFFWNYQLIYGRPNMSIDFNWTFFIKKFYNLTLFNSKVTKISTTNIVPLSFFKSSIKKRVIKTLSNDIYIPRTTVYFYKTLINFIEYHTGRKVFLKLNPFLEGSLTFKDSCRCSIWYNKISIFQKILGHRIFVHESLRIFMAAVRFRDPTFLANWIRSMLYRMSFWKYRVLFRYIKYVFRALLLPYFSELDFKGVRLVVRGKISVAGNARARTLAFSVGNTSNSEVNNRVLSSFNTIDSFTGVMGFRLTFYF